ncbi:MAG: adenylate/guanylate cyclase domain-containing protein [Chloroflexota bacterium]|nr:adenylate/guanylate cyclase domain-containing protein [Chloroflexota bacterium]
MNCPQCQYECPPDFSFCPKCGAALERECTNCGHHAPSDFAFCPKCGSSLSAVDKGTSVTKTDKAMSPTLESALQRLVPQEYAERLREVGGHVTRERRLVTILFSDVKGYTAMAEKLDPEDVMEIMDESFEVLIEPVYKYEGTLARLMGDALLAFFGAPIGHEDDPERAIRAGLDIVAGAWEYADKLNEERGIEDFNVRVGINTGLVVVGEVGSNLHVEYTAMGDAVNLAARMEQNAPPGGVLITHDTYKHVRGVFDVQPQEPISVKGKADPVSTYLVERAKPRAFRVGTRGVEGIETRMVGREAEMLVIQNAFQDTLEDAETRLVTIVGDAGVGKTRLLDEFFNWIELRPERIWYFKGRSSGTTKSVPYSLWRDLFAFRFEILESDKTETALEKFRHGMAEHLEPDRAELVGELVGFDFSTSPAVAALLGSPNFGQLAKAYLVAYFRSTLAQQPVLILLEDLQWADDSSLALVGHLIDELQDAPLFVVGAARPELYERRPYWGEGLEYYSILELKPLSKRASRTLVDEILQRVQVVPDALRELVVKGSEGNPYYVEELLKVLIEDRVIERGDGVWTIDLERLAEVQVPATLTGILQARLDALPGAEKAVLQRGSVVGRLFWDDLVGELSADVIDKREIAPLLGSLREREMVFQREQSAFADAREYTFKHSVLRDVTYETVLLKLRRRYHMQVAMWLEAHAGERLGEYLGLIAGHYELGGDKEKAAEYLRRSGEDAFKVSAYRDAVETFDRALELLPEDCQAERAQVLVAIGRALVRLGDFDLASERFEAGLAIARSIEEREMEAGALIGLGEVSWSQGSYEIAQRYLGEGFQLTHENNYQAEQALAAQHLARVNWLLGENEKAVHWGEKSRALYEQIGDLQGLASALNELGIVAVKRKEFDKARMFFKNNLTLAEEIGDRFRMAQAMNNLGEVARDQGLYEDAHIYYKQACVIMEEIGQKWGEALVLGNLGLVCVKQDKYDAAWGYVRHSLMVTHTIQDIPRTLSNLVMIGLLWVRNCEHERAAQILGLALHHPASYIEVEAVAQPALAELREEMPGEELEAALERGKALDLEQVVNEILAVESYEDFMK